MSFVDEPFAKHMIRVSSARRVRAGLAVGEPIAQGGRGVDAVIGEAHGAVQALVHQARAALR
jgi:hypothetical protein